MQNQPQQKVQPQQVVKHLQGLADPSIAEHSARFFKTGPGEYGEGDRFLGIRVPVIRKQVKQFKHIELADTLELLTNPYHEIRLFAVLKLVDLFEKGSHETQTQVYKAYLNNTSRVNNWDLVDSSAHKIVGAFLFDKPRDVLYELANSKLLWESVSL